MAEGTCPQVFVVDHQIHCAPPPIKPKPLWNRAGRNLLVLVLGLVVFGLVLEGIFIYRLSKRTELFSQLLFDSRTHNQSNLPTSIEGQTMGQLGTSESNEVLLNQEKISERPMAHLQGSNTAGTDGLVQWMIHNNGFTNNMEFNSSGLVIRTQGYYYLYSKVHFEETEDCVMVNHRVIKNTTEYRMPRELMKSKSLYCRNQKNEVEDKNLWNSFLAGLFELKAGDHIYVTLDKGLFAGHEHNFFGAFKMS